MAAGVNTDLKNDTKEGLALEAILQLQAHERVAENNPDGRNFITGTYNSDTGIFSGTFALPVDLTFDATTGNAVLTAVEYLD